MDKVLGMIEQNHSELVALGEVISVEESKDYRPGATVDAHNIAEPTNSEGRRRRRTWNFAFVMAKMRHPSRSLLQSATPDVAQDYADYLLGEDSLNLDAVDVEGMTVARSSRKAHFLMAVFTAWKP